MMVNVLEYEFEFFLATSHWWQPSTALLMIVPISIFFPHSCFIDLLCPGCTRTYVHTWDCSCEHSPGCTRTFGRGGCPSMQQSGLSLLLFLCAFFMTSFHFVSIVAFASGINIAWNERSFVFASRFPEACVSEKQISRIFWTICNSWFPKFAELNNIRNSYFFLLRFSLESILYSPDFEVYLNNFVSQIRCAARRNNIRLLSPSEKFKWRAFLRSFHRNEFLALSCNNVQNYVLYFNINAIEFLLPQMF